jgi:hypothetical protein
MDQNPPMTRPTMIRATSTTQKAGAHALRKLASASTASQAPSIDRLSNRAVATVATGAVTAATRPGTVIIRPDVPADTANSAAIGSNSPIGRISAVTITKIPAVMVDTASHGRRAAPDAVLGSRSKLLVCRVIRHLHLGTRRISSP